MGDPKIKEPFQATAQRHSTAKKYLVFLLNQTRYAVPLAEVREVIGLPEYIPVPGSPDYALGLIDLRGNAIMTIDLKKKIGAVSEGAKIKRPAVIICEVGGSPIGCVVDAVLEVLTVSDDQIDTSLAYIQNTQADLIKGVARFPNREMILILGLAKLAHHTDACASQDKNEAA